jgi:hypothetical protein
MDMEKNTNAPVRTGPRVGSKTKNPRALASIARGFVAIMALAVVVGIVAERLDSGGPATKLLPELPPSLVAELAGRFPAADYIFVFGMGSCGSPFRAALNFLHVAHLRNVAVVTGSTELPLMRELVGRHGVDAVADDRLLASTLPYGNLVVVDRSAAGIATPLVYQFDVVPTARLIQTLSEVLGWSPPIGSSPVRPVMEKR